MVRKHNVLMDNRVCNSSGGQVNLNQRSLSDFLRTKNYLGQEEG